MSEKSTKLPASQKASGSSYEPPKWFWESRKKGPSTSGTLVWTALRSLDLPLQWWFLKSGAGVQLLQHLGATAVAQPLIHANTGTALGLSPYHTVILGLAVGSSLKQIYWKAFVSENVMPVKFSIIVSVYNTFLNSFNTSLALWVVTSQQPTDQSSLVRCFETAPPSFFVGLGLYSIGILTEWWCEIQRKAFKQKLENKDRPYAGGLFSLARNINYGGYTLWRSGYSLICGGWIWAGVMASWLAGDFTGRAIPNMEAYCTRRYGEQWTDVCRRVPYRLLPWIY